MNEHFQSRRSVNEKGVVLLITMVFLLLFAIVAAAVFRGSITSIQAVGNMHWRTEAVNATHEAVAHVLSDYAGFIQPALTRGLAAVDAKNASFYSDVNGDGETDIVVIVNAIECNSMSEVRQEDIDPNKPEDLACLNSSNMNSSTFCSEVQFSLMLTATDRLSEASVQMEQGIGVRVTNAGFCEL